MKSTLLIRTGTVSDHGNEVRSERDRRKKEAEKEARAALERLFSDAEGVDAWRAIEIAENANLPWRMVACALRRMARRGEVIEYVVEYRSPWRSKEQTRLYGLRVKVPQSNTNGLWWLVNFA